MTLLQIVWISEATRPLARADLLALLGRSRARNIGRGLTGLLLFHEGSFLQFMEGEATAVLDTFEHWIVPSKLHRDVTLLLRQPVAERNFPDWSMGFIDTSHTCADHVPGFQDFLRTSGIFLKLQGDNARVRTIIDGFHRGRWHLHEAAL